MTHESQYSSVKSKLVSCKGCGVVFKRDNVPDERCPVCHATTRKMTSIPRIGSVHKYWEEL